MDNYHTICYVSKIADDITKNEIDKLFDESSAYNQAKDITGILLAEMGSFFQVLEGEKKLINSLFEKIKKDSRHHDVYLVFDRKTSDPVFKGYNSKFNVVKTYEDLQLIKKYLDQNKYHSTSDKISRLLTPFIFIHQ